MWWWAVALSTQSATAYLHALPVFAGYVAILPPAAFITCPLLLFVFKQRAPPHPIQLQLQHTAIPTPAMWRPLHTHMAPLTHTHTHTQARAHTHTHTHTHTTATPTCAYNMPPPASPPHCAVRAAVAGKLAPKVCKLTWHGHSTALLMKKGEGCWPPRPLPAALIA